MYGIYLHYIRVAQVLVSTLCSFKASVLEFYSPGRFYVQGQGSKQQETLLIISKSLQEGRDKGPSMTPYLPCVGEICGVQFSYDLVSRGRCGIAELTVSSIFKGVTCVFAFVLMCSTGTEAWSRP